MVRLPQGVIFAQAVTMSRAARPGNTVGVDRPDGVRQYRGMRFIVFALLLFLAACGADPAALGITGGAMAVPPVDPGEAQTGTPGAPRVGTQLAPSLPANTGAGKYWGYN
jgi:hypothetical protein